VFGLAVLLDQLVEDSLDLVDRLRDRRGDLLRG